MNRWYGHGYHNPLSLKLIFGIIPRFPRWLHPPIAVVTAMLFLVLLKSERSAVATNLRRVSGGGRARIWWKTYRVFYSFCDFMVSYCYVPGASHEQLLGMLVDPDRGAAKIERCLAQGNGLIVWTAHVGNWEFASRLLEMHGRQVNVVRAVEQGNPAEMALRQMMENDRLRSFPVNEDILGSLELLGALRRNEIVAIQGDRTHGGRDAAVQFFSDEVRFPLGPFYLSYLSGAPILPGIVVREGWLRYRVVMGEPIVLPRTDDRNRDLMTGLLQAARFLETAITTHHCQWLNFYRFWSADTKAGDTAESLTTAGSKV